MSKKQFNTDGLPVSDEEFEAALWKRAIAIGLFVPTTVEEVACMEEILSHETKKSFFSVPSVEMILSRLDVSVDLKSQIPEPSEEETYALAARKGQQVSVEAKAKMAKLKNAKKKTDLI